MDRVAGSVYCPSQTGEIVALKKVALRRLEDGIPNQALREIKALQEIEDNQYVSGAGVLRCLVLPSFTHFHPGGPTPTLLPYLLPHSSLTPILIHIFILIHPVTSFLIHSLFLYTHFFLYSFIHFFIQ